MLQIFYSCNINYIGSKNKKKIKQYFGVNVINGEIKIIELAKLLNKKSKDSSNLIFIDSILTFQNIGFFFDSNGYIKDLVGSNYNKKNVESISLAIDYYNFDRPISIPTVQNRLPEKLELHFNELLSIANIGHIEEITDSNKILVFIAPNQTNKIYLKNVKIFNWRKLFSESKSKLLFIKE
jgi:hypothetical protein